MINLALYPYKIFIKIKNLNFKTQHAKCKIVDTRGYIDTYGVKS